MYQHSFGSPMATENKASRSSVQSDGFCTSVTCTVPSKLRLLIFSDELTVKASLILAEMCIEMNVSILHSLTMLRVLIAMCL